LIEDIGVIVGLEELLPFAHWGKASSKFHMHFCDACDSSRLTGRRR
jgi:hypothetical protein